MREEIICRETKDGHRFYDFECPACSEAGEIGLPIDTRGRFGCPAGCGAVFVEYKALCDWRIRCVVQPVYAEP
jgi:hypothetical protein